MLIEYNDINLFFLFHCFSGKIINSAQTFTNLASFEKEGGSIINTHACCLTFSVSHSHTLIVFVQYSGVWKRNSLSWELLDNVNAPQLSARNAVEQKIWPSQTLTVLGVRGQFRYRASDASERKQSNNKTPTQQEGCRGRQAIIIIIKHHQSIFNKDHNKTVSVEAALSQNTAQHTHTSINARIMSLNLMSLRLSTCKSNIS